MERFCYAPKRARSVALPGVRIAAWGAQVGPEIDASGPACCQAPPGSVQRLPMCSRGTWANPAHEQDLLMVCRICSPGDFVSELTKRPPINFENHFQLAGAQSLPAPLF